MLPTAPYADFQRHRVYLRQLDGGWAIFGTLPTTQPHFISLFSSIKDTSRVPVMWLNREWNCLEGIGKDCWRSTHKKWNLFSNFWIIKRITNWLIWLKIRQSEKALDMDMDNWDYKYKHKWHDKFGSKFWFFFLVTLGIWEFPSSATISIAKNYNILTYGNKKTENACKVFVSNYQILTPSLKTEIALERQTDVVFMFTSKVTQT